MSSVAHLLDTEKRIRGFKDSSIEMSRIQIQSGKRTRTLKNNETISKRLLRVTGKPEGEEDKVKEIFEIIMSENYPKLIIATNCPQIWETQRITNKINTEGRKQIASLSSSEDWNPDDLYFFCKLLFNSMIYRNFSCIMYSNSFLCT